jgi:hypothetical protein
MTATSASMAQSRTGLPSLQSLADGAAILLLGFVAAIAFLTFRDYGLGWDDYTQSEYGDLLVALYSSGFRDTRALSFVNLYEYGGGFDLLAALLGKILPYGLFPTRRLLGAVVGIVGLFVTWRIARRLGGPLAGTLALILLATCPLYYGHMFMNAKDAPFAVAMTILLYGTVRIFEDYPRPSPPGVVAFGIGLGLAIGSRIIGGLAAFGALAALVLILVADLHAKGLRASLGRLGQFVLSLLPGFLLGYLVMGLVWPWGIVDPLNPIRALLYFSKFFEQPWKELFAGQLILVPDMPWSYLPTLLALKLPEIMLILALGGALGVLVRMPQREIPVPHRAALVIVALAATAPIAITFITRPAFYNGIRQFVFLTPPIAVLGGLAGAWLLDRLRDHGAAPLGAAVVLFALGVAPPVIEMVRLHPYQYTYFNYVGGGVPAARGRYMLDYWGLSFKEASEELLAKLAERGETQPPPGRRWVIATCGPHRPAQVGLGPNFETTWDSKGADFALMLGEFYCARLDAPLLAEVAREGVVYARVYDLRGRSIPTLLTIPPP